MNRQRRRLLSWLSGILLSTLLLVGCGGAARTEKLGQSDGSVTAESAATPKIDMLPELSPLALNGRKVRAVATTNLVGDVVEQIGQDNIDLTTLLAPGIDPHSYQLRPADRQKLED